MLNCDHIKRCTDTLGVESMNIYQHFRTEEHELIDQLIDKCNQADQTYAPVLTHFLDPRGQYILEVVAGSYDMLQVHFYGGPHAERQRALIAPDYFEPQLEDFELTVLQLDYPKKFVTIQHQHVMGTILSLGITRDQLGDIAVNDEIQFVIASPLVDYVKMHLTKIKGASVKLHSISPQDMVQSKESWQHAQATVSALRLDVVLKEMIHKSRDIAKQLIQKKRVKVNHTIIDSADFKLDQGDLLSIQGFGRAKISEVGGKTKKDKIHISYKTLFK